MPLINSVPVCSLSWPINYHTPTKWGSPVNSFHDNPSPSVSHKLTCGSPIDSSHGYPPRSDPIECDRLPTFSTPSQTQLIVYLLSLSQTDTQQSDGLLPRQPVSIGSDGVRLPTFSSPLTTIPCCIYTTTLANWHAAVRWTRSTATRLHRIRWSPFANIFHPPHNYTLLYIY